MLEPGGIDSTCICMGRACLWDSEEQHREWTVQLMCSLLLYGTKLTLGQRRGNRNWTEQMTFSSLHNGKRLPLEPFVHFHDLSYHDVLLEQSSVQLVKAIRRRQHRGHKEIIHGLYKL